MYREHLDFIFFAFTLVYKDDIFQVVERLLSSILMTILPSTMKLLFSFLMLLLIKQPQELKSIIYFM